MKQILLTQNKYALVDDGDYERLNQWKWHAQKHKHSYYAKRHTYSKGKQGTVWMHRIVLDVLPKVPIDHKNRNGLDNRRCNLRICTDSENKFNQMKRGVLSSYKGVRPAPKSNKWEARIQKWGKRISLGLFETEEGAAQAYDEKARELFDEFARTNF